MASRMTLCEATLNVDDDQAAMARAVETVVITDSGDSRMPSDRSTGPCRADRIAVVAANIPSGAPRIFRTRPVGHAGSLAAAPIADRARPNRAL
jgi:hypothetical protein